LCSARSKSYSSSKETRQHPPEKKLIGATKKREAAGGKADTFGRDHSSKWERSMQHFSWGESPKNRVERANETAGKRNTGGNQKKERIQKPKNTKKLKTFKS